MFIKKLFLGGTILILPFISIVALSSCSSGSEGFDLGIPEEQTNYYSKIIATLPKDKIKKTRLITDSGRVNDKSFNESALGALKLFQNQVKNAELPSQHFDYQETSVSDDLHGAYDNALNDKVKIWVLTGFQQADIFKSWLKISGNKQAFTDSKSIIVGVDWDGGSFIPPGQFFGLGFKTQEASWVVGKAASEYLSTTQWPYLSSFGGGVFNGVTDFNNGFLQGMLDWNKRDISNNAKVKFYSGNNPSDAIELDTGFIETQDVYNGIEALLGSGDTTPKIILPVAGSLTTTTLQIIKNRRSDQLIIGVDTNQSIAFPADKTKFFTSIEKNIGLAVYKVMIMLSGIDLDFHNGIINDAGFEGGFVPIDNINNTAPQNFFVKHGFDKGFVGYSSSTLSGEKATIVNALLKKYYNQFNTTPPTFEDMTDPTLNQAKLNVIIAEINS